MKTSDERWLEEIVKEFGEPKEDLSGAMVHKVDPRVKISYGEMEGFTFAQFKYLMAKKETK